MCCIESRHGVLESNFSLKYRPQVGQDFLFIDFVYHLFGYPLFITVLHSKKESLKIQFYSYVYKILKAN